MAPDPNPSKIETKVPVKIEWGWMCSVDDLAALLKEWLCCHGLHVAGVQAVLTVSQKL